MKRNTRFQPGVSGNAATQWQPGLSGNPAGKSKLRTQFEATFSEALVAEGSPEEAARLLWQAARKHEPWAIQELCRRFAPQTPSLRLIHEEQPDDQLDYAKLTDEQLQQLDAIIQQAGDQPVATAEGESTPQPI